MTCTYVPSSGPTKADPFPLFPPPSLAPTPQSDVMQDTRLFRVGGKNRWRKRHSRRRESARLDYIVSTCFLDLYEQLETANVPPPFSVAEMSCCSLADGFCRNMCSKVRTLRTTSYKTARLHFSRISLEGS